jgi:NitT/TauT family transport system substrate-binding protein
MSRKLLAMFLVLTVASSVFFFSVGYYIGYRIGYDAAFLTPIRIGYLLADIHQISFFVAYYEGFYEEEGIRPVKLEYVNGPTEMMALAAGDLDAGYAGVVPALIAKSQGVDLVIVASANLEGSAIVAKPDIKTVQDLDGKTIGTPGIGTIQASLLYMVEQKLNITVIPKHYEGPVLLPLDFEKGTIDAYIAWEPFVAEVVVKGLGNVTYTSHDILPNHQCCIFYVSGKMFREQPDLVKKLIKVHLKAMKFISERPDDAMKIFADRTGKDLAVVQESWKRMKWDSHLNITSMKTFVDYLIEQGKISSDDVPNIDEFINTAIDQQLLTEVEAVVP